MKSVNSDLYIISPTTSKPATIIPGNNVEIDYYLSGEFVRRYKNHFTIRLDIVNDSNTVVCSYYDNSPKESSSEKKNEEELYIYNPKFTWKGFYLPNKSVPSGRLL